MRMHDEIDFTALSWVKRELDDTLKQARQALEAFVEDPSDTSQMRFCATYLHQVHGTLHMVELHGAALVLEEMEATALDLLEGRLEQTDEVYDALIRGMVQLPDYLERLQSGHRDVPIVLLPLINEIRSIRGAEALNEIALFDPPLDVELPVPGPGQPVADAKLRSATGKLRQAFEAALLDWLRDADGAPGMVDRMVAICDKLATVTAVEPARRLWWICARVLEATGQGALEGDRELKVLLGKVDQHMRRQATDGERSLTSEETDRLARQLLFVAASGDGGSGSLAQLRELFSLDELVPDESELEHARGSMTGHNRELLDTVAGAIKEDLMAVKEGLDLKMRQGDLSNVGYEPLVEYLDKIGDTLGMLGLEGPREAVLEDRDRLRQFGAAEAEVTEEGLMDVAGSMLYVEAALDNYIERLGSPEPEPPAEDELAISAELPSSEVRRILDALMKESSENLQEIKRNIVEFIEAPWDHEKIKDAPRLLQEIVGALRMLDLEEAGDLLESAVRFIRAELLLQRAIPSAEQLDTLADAVASIEYYLEAVRERRPGREKILDVARSSLEKLGYLGAQGEARAAELEEAGAAEASEPDLPPEEALEPEAGAEGPAELPGEEMAATETPVEEGQRAQDGEAGQTAGAPDTAEETQEPAAVDAPGEAAAEGAVEAEDDRRETAADAAADIADDIDEEIREVFLEEVAEELELLDELYPRWRDDPDDHETLATIRRTFHTLKGSGRLVGAHTIGEFSWQIENLLNRVLDGTRQSGSAVLSLMDAAIAALPELLANVRGAGRPSADIEGIKSVAERLAAGEEAWLETRVEGVAEPEAAPEAEAFDTESRRRESEEVDEAIARMHRQMEASDEGEPEGGSLEAAREPEFDSTALSIEDHEAVDEWIADESQGEGEEASPVAADYDLSGLLDESHGAALPAEAGEEPAAADEEAASAAAEESGEFEEPSAGAGPVPGLDPVLIDILRGEVAGHLAVIEAYAGDWRAARGDHPATEELLRAVHTLNGAVAMVDALHLAGITAPLERYVKRLRALERAPDEDGMAVVEQTVAVLRGVVDQLDAEAPEFPSTDGLAERLEALGDALPEESDLASALFPQEESPPEAVPQEDGTVFEAHPDEAEEAGETAVDVDALESSGLLEDAGEGAEEQLVAGEWMHLPAEVDALAAGDGEATGEVLDGQEGELQEQDLAFDDAMLDEAAIEGDLGGGDLAEAGAGEEARDEPVPEEESPPEAVAEHEAPEGQAEAQAGAPGETARDEPVPEEESPPEAVAEHEAPEGQADEAGEGAWEVPVEEPVTELEEAFPDTGADLQLEELPSVSIVPEEEPEQISFESLGDLDQELLEIFVQEGEEILDEADHGMVSFRERPGDTALITELQRELHTLKGGARMAGVGPLGDLSHSMESIFEALVEQSMQVSLPVVELLEHGFDRLHQMLDAVGRREPMPGAAALVTRFDALLAGQSPEAIAAGGATPAAEAPETGGEPEQPVPAAAPAARPTALDEMVAERGVAPARPQQELIRVRADLLDNLVNYAGEVSIYRARLDQQVGTFRFNLVEFEQTVSRLRDQLRKLEIETEAQILSRYQREAEEFDEDFDPLELDRFSQLQQYSRALAESVADLVSIQGMLEEITRESETLLLQQSRVNSDLQEGLMRTRMVPFDSLVPRLRRILRQTSQELHKKALLRVEGAQGEMDRTVLERITAPLEHMLRNAVAHGLETPEQRLAVGKPEEGAIRIRVSREATEVVLQVDDDGAGIDAERVRAKALERGLLKEDAELTDDDLYGFILHSGFSTAEDVSKIAGRGVGMDVVNSEIKQLGGSLEIASRPGEGTSFTIRLPFTLAVTHAIMVRIGDATFAVPLSSIEGVARLPREEFERRLREGDTGFDYAGESYQLHELDTLLGLERAQRVEEDMLPILMSRIGDQRAAIRVDQVMSSREIVVKSVGPQISSIPGIFGATILGDGSVIMILDLGPLIRRGAALRLAALEEGEVALEAEVEAGPKLPLVMVVDDSITMRKVTSRVLERHDMEVITAKDGVDAVEQLQERIPDLMLLDIEMPRMDGYEVATHMRNDERLRGVPIIMITSRTGEKHRQRALEIGVNRYLGKPYQEAELLENVQQLLKETIGAH